MIFKLQGLKILQRKNLAGIVLYNPDLSRLSENINAIISQVDQLVLVDNGSIDQSHLPELAKIEKVVIVKNGDNKGIAGALNQILEFADENRYEWVLTLDQDSVVSKDIIGAYNQFVNKDSLGMLTCNIIDRNFILCVEEDDGEVEMCITSGSYVRVEAWKDIKGFDESMFIDSVDFDFCLSLRKHNWKIFRTYKTNILHEVGKSKVVKILGREYLALNHSPLRCYYIIRNRVYIGRKHNMGFKSFKVIMRLFYTVLIFEQQKMKKLVMMIKGLFVGLSCKINRNDKFN
ncbi:glycosyltransferase family 2 protein [Arcticibacter tournemirensis]|uniref:Glycosyltransferase family 2 protein n=1 Tax=Arcticibacter tournemirensis TaxID=699437 RepID=A0A4Q0M8A2_9SPHI|nr:glycosyltransferase family 2 protein [Arcticibacter tournemirensis]RXF69361.1 glycosyltransferase family 2 protein [Arcticibacter tournemirensis]